MRQGLLRTDRPGLTCEKKSEKRHPPVFPIAGMENLPSPTTLLNLKQPIDIGSEDTGKSTFCRPAVTNYIKEP